MHDAQMAAINIIHGMYGPKPVTSTREVARLHDALRPYAFPPSLPGGREMDGHPLDMMAPSFWHACCAVLFRSVRERFAAQGEPDITVYRGQACQWPAVPTGWRIGNKKAFDKGLHTFRQFLDLTEKDRRHQTLEFFPDFFTLQGIRGFAQHHEFPTTLLDFTFHPLVALFFATRDCVYPLQLDHQEAMGVIYSCNFTNMPLIKLRTGFHADFTLAPPDHVYRLYQQKGFFIDCGDDIDHANIEDLERACQKIYFPRTYPAMEGLDRVFTEKEIFFFLDNIARELTLFHHQLHAPAWYDAFDYYVDAAQQLRSFIHSHPGDYDEQAALEVMQASTNPSHRPLQLLTPFGESRMSRDMRIAETMASAANAIYFNAVAVGACGTFISSDVLMAYAKANPQFFEALFEIGKRVEIFRLEKIANAFRGVPGIEEMVTGSLHPEQLKIARTITKMCHP